MESHADSFRPSWLRSLGNALGIIGLFLLLLINWARIDSPEGMTFHMKEARFIAALLAISVFLLAYWFGYFWRLSHRLAFALAIASIVCIIAWQISLYYGHYQEKEAQRWLEKNKTGAQQTPSNSSKSISKWRNFTLLHIASRWQSATVSCL